MKLLLASASPRRQQLLRSLTADFEVFAPNVDEESLTCADPFATAERLALAKARAGSAIYPDDLCLGGDTVVTFHEKEAWQQLAKPSNHGEAFRMLSLLSGRTHVVATGVALVWSGGEEVFVERTEVTFRGLKHDEIWAYIATGEPMDKAGAYGLQNDPHGFIQRVVGSRNNVIGLPTEALAPRLARFLG